MKAYYLVSPYLSDIQKGIQVSHCTCEMAVAATYLSSVTNDFYEWAQKHKTMIVLNYGTDKKLVEIIRNHLIRHHGRFWSAFEERELNNLPTIGMILSTLDVRKIGQFRQEKRFIISKELRMIEDFAINIDVVNGRDYMSKRDWIETLLEQDDPEISDKDFLRIISTLHMA